YLYCPIMAKYGHVRWLYQELPELVSQGIMGFARFVELLPQPPESGDYLRVEYSGGSGNETHFRLPFERFYMEKSKAGKWRG
ncbi:MAG: hypothetical protein N3A66_05630, partial [Planctomycetota bacterium]|nr:hypothetical protein [Planctomycetota bacterium]